MSDFDHGWFGLPKTSDETPTRVASGGDPVHLWEVDHPYYADDGDYYTRDQHSRHESWAEFSETTFHGGDRDRNHLYRWDWHKAGHHGWNGRELLSLHFVLQRKAICCSVDIEVTGTDEPAIRAWLVECAGTVRDMWTPLDLAVTGRPPLR